MKNIAIGVLVIVLLSCHRVFKTTKKVCNNKFYVETFSNSFIDESEEFLTDSISFRIRVGVVDNEHSFFYYRCTGDTLIIQLIARDTDSLGNRKILEDKKYLISKIEKEYKIR